MVHNFQNTNSLVSRFVGELRDIRIQQDRMRFRKNLERVAEIFAYEISRTLLYKEKDVETPLGIAKVNFCSDKIVIGNILRAGMPMHNGMLNYFDQADSAFVSAYRRRKFILSPLLPLDQDWIISGDCIPKRPFGLGPLMKSLLLSPI